MDIKANLLYDWLDNWLEVYAKPKVVKSTYDTYRTAIINTKKCIDDCSLDAIVEMDIQLVLNTLCDIGYSRSTIHTAKVALNMAFEKAIKNKLIQDNPVTDTFIPKEAGEKDIIALTQEEQRVVESACYEDLHGILFIFLLHTGLRRAELCNLKWNDFDKKKGVIYVRKSKTKNGIRCVPLIPLCQQIIMSRPKINEYIFNSTNKNPITPSVLKKTYLRLRKATGIDTITNHVCRHTFATRLLESGADAKAISSLLGHSSVSFTMTRYTHAQVEYLRKQIDLIA